MNSKNLILICVFTISIDFLSCYAQKQLTLPIIIITVLTGAYITPVALEKNKCDSSKFFDCSDCNTRVICDTNGEPLQSDSCNNSTPYCNQGICVSKQPSTCHTPIPKLCPGVGFYPSPTSCNRYNHCSAKGLITDYVCPSPFVYDPESTFCKPRTSNADCPNINCANNEGKFVVYPLNKQLFFFCRQNDTLLLSCNQNEEFNPNTLYCEFACTASGNFANSFDETRYYLCVKTAPGVFDKYDLSCGYGFKFDTGAGNCVPE